MADARRLQRDTGVGIRTPKRYPGRVSRDTAPPPPSPRLPQARPFEAGDRTLNAGDPIPIAGEPSIRPSSRAQVRAALRPRDFAGLQDRELEEGHFAHNHRLAAARAARPSRSVRSRR